MDNGQPVTPIIVALVGCDSMEIVASSYGSSEEACDQSSTLPLGAVVTTTSAVRLTGVALVP